MKKLLLLAILFASPLMAQETGKTPLKSIVSINYVFGAMDSVDTEHSVQSYNFQMQSQVEYILGKKWHWYIGTGTLLLDAPMLSWNTGFGATFVDTRNVHGLGWMFDWNILTVGAAYTADLDKAGLVYTSNLRARHSVSKKFSIQMGFDSQLYVLFDVHDNDIFVASYNGVSVGFAFGH